MATNLPHVLDNFYWRIEAITPTYSGVARAVPRFRAWDPMDGKAPNASTGWTRRFWVERLAGAENEGATSDNLREAVHTYHVHILYDNAKHRRTQAIIAYDRHDIAKPLRGEISTDHRKGYDDDHSTTDIGLMSRWRGEDQTVDYKGNPKIKEVIMEYFCSVRESEV